MCSPEPVLRESLPTKDADEFIDETLAFCGIRRGHGAVDAMAEMLAQQIAFDSRQRCADRFDLGDDIDAVAIVYDHLRDTANLPLDPLQRRECLLRNSLIQWIPLLGT